MYEDVIEVESAKERFMGNNALFLKFLYEFPNRSLFGDLDNAIKAGDANTAFEVAHTMKGIAANLSLKAIAQPLHEVVEVLRKRELPSDEQWEALSQAYQRTVEDIARIKEEGVTFF